MKKYIHIILSILQILLLIATTLLHHFTNTRMGMSRHMIYFNNEVSLNYNLDLLFRILYFTLVIFILITLKWCLFNHSTPELFLQGVIHIISCIILMGYTFYYSPQIMLSFYILSIGLGSIILLQHIALFSEKIGYANVVKKSLFFLLSVLYVILKVINKILTKKEKALPEDYPH